MVHGGNPEEGWLDEGLSIVAEELGSLYYEQKCPGTTCRTDPSQLFPDSSQAFISGFLFDSYFYALRPDTASVTLHSDADDGFSWRGGDSRHRLEAILCATTERRAYAGHIRRSQGNTREGRSGHAAGITRKHKSALPEARADEVCCRVARFGTFRFKQGDARAERRMLPGR